MKISKDVIVRTVVLALCLINQICVILGRNTLDIAESDIYQIISVCATIASSGWAWWKNNSFTEPAIKADEVMKELKKTT